MARGTQLQRARGLAGKDGVCPAAQPTTAQTTIQNAAATATTATTVVKGERIIWRGGKKRPNALGAPPAPADRLCASTSEYEHGHAHAGADEMSEVERALPA